MAKKVRIARLEDRIQEDNYRFGTMSGVMYTQAQFEKATSETSRARKHITLKKILKDRIEALQHLVDICEVQEKEFFTSLNLPSGAAGLKLLGKKIDEWKLSGAMRLLDQDVALQVLEAFDDIDIEELQKAMNEAFYDNTGLLELLNSEIMDNEIKNAVISILNDTIDQLDIPVNSFQKGSSSSSKRGLIRFLSQVSVENGQVHIEFDEKMPRRYKQRILIILKEKGYMVNQKQNSGAQKIEERVFDILGGYVTGKPRMYIENRVKRDFKQFGMYPALPSVKGALGEIYWAALFDYLNDSKNSTVPVGLKRDSDKKQLNIDLIVEGYGFQVKNYTLKNGSVIEFSGNNKTVGAFITRMGVENSLSEIMRNFFCSWAYNQPIEGEQGQMYEQQVYNRFQELADSNGTNRLLSAYIDKIIGLDKNVKGEIAEGLEQVVGKSKQNLYLNTFFLINEKMVPSSYLLRAIIQTLQRDYSAVSMESSFIAPPTGKTDTWPRRLDMVNEKRDTYANRVRINYSISIDLTRVLQNVYKELQDF